MPTFCRQCPNCGNPIHVRKLACLCGHEFRSKTRPLTVTYAIRAVETKQQSSEHRSIDRNSKALKQVLESEEQSSERKAVDAACRKHKRASETEEQSSECKAIDAACKKRKRASETEKQSLERRARNTECKMKSRANTSLQANIDSRQTVVPLDRLKYTNASPGLLGNVFTDLHSSFDDKYWVCKTCDAALCRGKMPIQAKSNGLKLSTIPPERAGLNPLEVCLISLQTMKMVALPSGKQRCIHGPAVNVPSKLDNVCTALPRLPSQSELIHLKFKRKLAYKGHYMYDYVTPEKILNALRWLKVNNPLYANVQVTDNWSYVAESEDFDLHADLLNLSVPFSEPVSNMLNSALAPDHEYDFPFLNLIAPPTVPSQR